MNELTEGMDALAAIRKNMTYNRLELFDNEHKKRVLAIKMMCDPDHPDNAFPEHREAARLCKFLLERQHIYELFLFEEIEFYGEFYADARCFYYLCNNIYHALTDDGEICYANIDGTPRILFQSRWEATLDTVYSKNEKEIWKSVKEFLDSEERDNKPVKNPPTQTLKFYNNSREFMEAVEELDKKKLNNETN